MRGLELIAVVVTTGAAALLVGTNLGCTAARGTVHLVKAEQALYLARESGAPERAAYAWTMAEEYMLKAREEWGHSDFGPAEDYSKKALEWAEKADALARKAEKDAVLQQMEVVPEEVDRSEQPARPQIESREERLEVPEPDLDEEEE